MMEFLIDCLATWIIFFHIGWAASMLFFRDYSTESFCILFTGSFIMPFVYVVESVEDYLLLTDKRIAFER